MFCYYAAFLLQLNGLDFLGQENVFLIFFFDGSVLLAE